MRTDFDVAVIGGGPAGSTAASYLARAGLSVVVLESETFPREHVGESLVPATTAVLDEIGALPVIDAAGFPKKFGASWTSPTSRDIPQMDFTGSSRSWDADIRFTERAQAGVDRDYTFHVDRGRFDAILLRHAADQGATVLNGIRVRHVDFEQDGGVTLRAGFGARDLHVDARMVVDASGRQTLLGRQLKIKKHDPVFDQFAVHTWFDGFDRAATTTDATARDNIFIHFLPVPDTWLWQIPITDTITSIGVVTQKKNLRAFGADSEEFFWSLVSSRADIHDLLRKARRVRTFRTEGDYSYAMKQICGDRYVLIGDAARFVDPIFSSGVSIALNSARIAAQDIIAAHRAGDFAAERFTGYQNKLRNATRYWYEFISVYYRLNVLFTAFVQDPRYRPEILRMLQGDVYDGTEPRILADLRAAVTAVENNPDHLWHPYLGTLRPPTTVTTPDR